MKVWGVAPISLVEAERNGATLVQRLAEMETSSSSDRHDSAVTELTDSHKKKANGHKEEGMFHSFCPTHACHPGLYVPKSRAFLSLKSDVLQCVNCNLRVFCPHISVSARGQWLPHFGLCLGCWDPCCPIEAAQSTVCMSASLPTFVVL